MAHSCPQCDQACYCDGEETWMGMEPVAENCIHCDEDDNCDYETDDVWAEPFNYNDFLKRAGK